MTRFLRLAIAVWLLAAPARLGHAEIAFDAVPNALLKYICFDAYWEGRDYRLGKTIKMTVNREGDWAFVWAERASKWGRYELDDFYLVFNLDGEAFVTHSGGVNAGHLPNDEFTRGYHAKIFGDGARTVSLSLPRNCAPKSGERTAQERAMLAVVERTVRNHLSEWNRQSLTSYASPLRIIIADFEWYYPRTFVFIPTTKQVYSVSFYKPMNPADDQYLRDGEYPMGFRRPLDTVIDRIRKHGIVRDIRLDG